MSNVTPKGNYPYPDPTDAVSDYPATAATFAGYVDNLPNRNVIINPFFDIWQRGTAPATTVSGTYTADRWRLDWDGTGGGRDVYASTPTLGTSIGGMQPYRAANVNVATLATGQSFMRFAQRIEGVRSLAGETATLSLYVSSTVAPKTVTIRAVQNFGTGGSPSSAVTTTIGTATTTTSYARKIYTFTVPALTGKTIGSAGNDYLEIHFDLGTQTGNFSFWGVQLEQNTTATALERRPIQQEIRLCQRYYETSFANGITPGTDNLAVVNAGGFVMCSNTTLGGYVQFLVRKRAHSGTASVWAPLNTPSANKARRGYDGLTVAASAGLVTETGFTVGITGGTSDQYQIGWASSSEL
jgi:hypothetical protein